MRAVRTTLASIGLCLGLVSLSTVTVPVAAWATDGARVIAGPTPSPFPTPGEQTPVLDPARPLVPIPAPLTPPAPSAAANRDVAFPRTAPMPAWFSVHIRAGVSTTPASLPLKPARAVADRAADTSATSVDLSRSLVYSGALALFIAGSGLIMLGFRRRLW